MPPEPLEALLREVLLQTPVQGLAKQYAVAMLQQLGARPPYMVWQDSRLAWVDPTQPPQAAPTFRQRFLTMRIHSAQKLCPDDRGIAPWAIEMVRRMDPAQRRALLKDHLHVWPTALAVCYRAQRGLPPLHLHQQQIRRLSGAGLSRALRTLRGLQKGGTHHADS